MGRFPQSIGKKGSQKWVQKLINENPDLLNVQIKKNFGLSEDEDIQWRSPLARDEYAEYRDQDFLNLLEVKLEKLSLADFWPARGPQWDALGKSDSHKLFLIEAKSHIPELISTMQAKDKDSREKIRISLDQTKTFIGSKAKIDWSQCFYQYTNRLAHLYLLRKKNQLPAYLVFVYFLNDSEMNGPTKICEWEGALNLLHSCLGIGRHKLQEFITDIFIDVNYLDKR